MFAFRRSASATPLIAAATACLISSSVIISAGEATAKETTTTTPTSPTSTSATSSSTEKTTPKKGPEKSSATKKPSKPKKTPFVEVPDDQLERYSDGPTTKRGQAIADRIQKVTDDITAGGGKIGLGFLDRETGEFVCNSMCDESFQLASLSKVFIAEMVGYTNYQPVTSGEIEAGSGDTPVEGNPDAMLRDDMIRYSDNEATNELWAKYGGAEMINNAKTRYRLSSSTVPNSDWGSTASSPADMVRYFDGILSSQGGLSDAETDYFVRLMYSVPRFSYGSADQNIGLRAALPKERIAVKGGWYDPQIRSVGGFMGEDDRYVVVALASYVSPSDFTDAIGKVFPEGRIPDEKSGNPQDVAAMAPLEAESSSNSVPLKALAGFVMLGVGYAAGYFMHGRNRSPRNNED